MGSTGGLLAVSLALCLLSASMCLAAPEGGREGYPEKVTIRFREVYDLNISRGQVDELKLYQPLPQDILTHDGAVIQEVASVEYEPEPNDESEWAVWTGSELTGERTYHCGIEMTSYAHQWEFRGSFRDIPQTFRERYLGNAWPVLKEENPDIIYPGTGETGEYRYSPEDPDMVRTVDEIVGAEEDPLAIMEGIYGWVMENTDEDSDGSAYGVHPKPASRVLEDGYGDPEGRALLLASMLRAADIPAWITFGLVLGEDGELARTAWTNVPLPGEDGAFVAEIYLPEGEFLFHSPYRYAVWTDTGLEIELDGKDIYNLKLYNERWRIEKGPFDSVDQGMEVRPLEYEEVGTYGSEGSAGIPIWVWAAVPPIIVVIATASILLLRALKRRR